MKPEKAFIFNLFATKQFDSLPENYEDLLTKNSSYSQEVKLLDIWNYGDQEIIESIMADNAQKLANEYTRKHFEKYNEIFTIN